MNGSTSHCTLHHCTVSQAGNLCYTVHCTSFSILSPGSCLYHLDNRIAAIFLISDDPIVIKNTHTFEMKRSHSDPGSAGPRSYKRLSRSSVARLAGTKVTPHVRRAGDFLIGKYRDDK